MLVLYWRQWYNLQILQKRKDRLWTSLVTAFLLPRKAAVKKVPNKLLWTWEALKIPTIEKQWIQFFKYSPMCFPSCEIWPYCTWGKCVMGAHLMGIWAQNLKNDWELKKPLFCLWMGRDVSWFCWVCKLAEVFQTSRRVEMCWRQPVNVGRNISLELGTCLQQESGR